MATVLTRLNGSDVSVDDTLRTPLVPFPKQITLPSRGRRAHVLRLATNRTLTSQTAAQSLFGRSFMAEAGKNYSFSMRVTLESLSATSGAFSLLFAGSATIGAIDYTAHAIKAALATATAGTVTVSKVATAVALVAANTATAGTITVTGTFRCTADGTFIPQIALGVAAAAVVDADSTMTITEMPTDEIDGNFI